MDQDRLEAVGQRGEACIILRRRSAIPDGQSLEKHSLATGEGLLAKEVAGEYATLDGCRTFRLRH